MSIGIPIKLLHEAEGHMETTVGEVYRGEAEDNMNCQMVNVTLTSRDGRVSQVEQIFIRGSMIRFFILRKNAPMNQVVGVRQLNHPCIWEAGEVRNAF